MVNLVYKYACINIPLKKEDMHTTEAITLLLFLVQIVVLWNCDKPLPPRNKWPSTSVPLTVTEGQTKVSGSC